MRFDQEFFFIIALVAIDVNPNNMIYKKVSFPYLSLKLSALIDFASVCTEEKTRANISENCETKENRKRNECLKFLFILFSISPERVKVGLLK